MRLYREVARHKLSPNIISPPCAKGGAAQVPASFISLPCVKGGGTAKRSDRVGGIVCICCRFIDPAK